MPDFIALTRVETKQTTLINKRLITQVCKADNPAGTYIEFEKFNWIIVKEDFEAVRRLLEVEA